MSPMASQITSVLIVCSAVCSGADRRNHRSCTSKSTPSIKHVDPYINTKSNNDIYLRVVWWTENRQVPTFIIYARRCFVIFCFPAPWCVNFVIQQSLTADGVMPWASNQIRIIAGCACAANAGNVFSTRRLQRKPLVSDPCLHHGMRVTHVPWYMSGSLTCGGGENLPGIPGACAPAIVRIWQQAHTSCA